MNSKSIKSILIANRGEIARRINRTIQKLGLKSICVYSDADSKNTLLEECHDAIYIGDSEPNNSYLNIEKIIKAAIKSKADAIHPGYGFLSENPDFAKACLDNNLIFIGPKSEVIELSADKRKSKEFAKKLNIPTSPALEIAVNDPNFNLQKSVKDFSDTYGFPLLIKAAFGGGGRGMRIINSLDDLILLSKSASDEAKKFFSSSEIFIEKLITYAKHIEVQILGSNDGKVIALGTRDCSWQRNYQKIIEEAPARSLSKELSDKLQQYAIKLGEAFKYTGAGTVEFLVKDNECYFLEVNSRIQVEHPVTEEIFGIDLVEAQIKISEGESIDKIFENNLSIDSHSINKHSMEVRICAENPREKFQPQTGRCSKIIFPSDIDSKLGKLRFDFAFDSSGEVSHYYDSMIGKVIALSDSRDSAIELLNQALKKLHIVGVQTNIEFLIKLLNDSKFIEDKISTDQLANNSIIYNNTIKYIEVLLAADVWNKNILNNSRSYKSFRNSCIATNYISGIINSIKYKTNVCWLEKKSNKIIGSIEDNKIELELISPNQILINNNLYFISKLEKNIYLTGELGGLVVYFPTLDLSLKNSPQLVDNCIVSSLPGKVIRIAHLNSIIKSGEEIAAIDSMKMEHLIYAPFDCIIENIFVELNQSVLKSAKILKINHA